MIRVCLALVLALSAAACGSTATSPCVPTATVPFSSTDLVVGTGTTATAGRITTVNYTGWVYDGTKTDNKGTQFDSSTGRGTFSFVLGAGQVISGWDQGVVGMKVGGKRRLVIPPTLAYGCSVTGSIPANSTLIFEIDLVAVQ